MHVLRRIYLFLQWQVFYLKPNKLDWTCPLKFILTLILLMHTCFFFCIFLFYHLPLILLNFPLSLVEFSQSLIIIYLQQLVLYETSASELDIIRDISRTFPSHVFFQQRHGPGQRSLYNVLKAYSVYDRDVGYVQVESAPDEFSSLLNLLLTSNHFSAVIINLLYVSFVSPL